MRHFILSILIGMMIINSQIPSPVANANSYEGLQNAISIYLNDGSDYSVYVCYPQKNSKPFIYNQQKWRAASMIKVFILAATMERVKDGTLSLDQNLTLHSYDKVGGAGILGGYSSNTQISLREVISQRSPKINDNS